MFALQHYIKIWSVEKYGNMEDEGCEMGKISFRIHFLCSNRDFYQCFVVDFGIAK